jgi:hypothetical protein
MPLSSMTAPSSTVAELPPAKNMQPSGCLPRIGRRKPGAGRQVFERRIGTLAAISRGKDRIEATHPARA